jgi:membrane fusion protein, multidrug efflux system
VISNPQDFLRPGQFVRVRMIGATRPNGIVVPQQSVIQTTKGHALYVVKDGKAELRNVEVGDWQGVGGWFITSGLKSDEEVIVKGTEKLRDGALVKVAQQSATETQRANTASQTAQ